MRKINDRYRIRNSVFGNLRIKDDCRTGLYYRSHRQIGEYVQLNCQYAAKKSPTSYVGKCRVGNLTLPSIGQKEKPEK